MTTGNDLVNAARTFLGEPYSTGPGRADPNSGYKDCSGLIAASYLVSTGRPLGADVSVTIYDLCVSQGLWCSFDQAASTTGACLLMPEDPYQGWGPNGHIGFSDGHGGTVEATPNRVQELPLHYQSWGSNACLLPGINYYGEEEDDMPQGFFVRASSSPYVWFISPFGYKVPTMSWKQIDIMSYVGFSSNNKDTIHDWSPEDLDSFPSIEDYLVDGLSIRNLDGSPYRINQVVDHISGDDPRETLRTIKDAIDEDGGLPGPCNPEDLSDEELIAEFNKRLESGDIDIDIIDVMKNRIA